MSELSWIAWLLVGLAFVLFILGAPVFVAFGITASLLSLFFLGVQPATIGSFLWHSIDKFAFLAFPLFIIMGNLMIYTGTSKHLILCANSLLGHVPGGLAMIVVISSAVLSTVIGSTLATVAAVGTMLYPLMVEKGYSKAFSGGVVVAASTLGPIIPPSTWAILYCAITEVDIGHLFVALTLPGIIITVAFIPYIWWYVRKKERASILPKASWGEMGRSLAKSAPVLVMPVIVLGGIYGGVFTPTEAAAVGCVYVIVVCGVAYRQLNWKGMAQAFVETARTLGNLMLLIVAALLLGFALFQMGLTHIVTNLFVGVSATTFTVIYILLMLVLSIFLDDVVILFLTVPILFPTAVALGINPILLGVIITIVMSIGQISPPMATAIFTFSSMTGVPSESIFPQVIPYILIEATVVFLILFVPQIALWLPSLLAVH